MSFKLAYEGQGGNTSRAMSSYNANRNKAMNPKLSYPKLSNPSSRTNTVTSGMQATADQRFNSLNFSR